MTHLQTLVLSLLFFASPVVAVCFGLSWTRPHIHYKSAQIHAGTNRTRPCTLSMMTSECIHLHS